MPALPIYLTDALWSKFSPLLPHHLDHHPLGCHRPRIGDRVIFEKLLLLLATGCSYAQASDSICSATTIRRRRNEWIGEGVMTGLEVAILSLYDTRFGLVLSHLAIDGCITKAPGGGQVAGKSPVDRGKLGLKKSVAVDGNGIPLAVEVAPANVPDSHLLAPTLAKVERLGLLTNNTTLHLDKGYRGARVRKVLDEFDIKGKISEVWGEDRRRWVVERTNAWHNRFLRLSRCTEVTRLAVEFFVSLANAIIVLKRYFSRLEKDRLRRRELRMEG